MRVGLIGLGAVGEACAHLLASSEAVMSLVLANRTEGVAQAVRMDLEQSRSWRAPLRARSTAPWTRRAFLGCDVIILTAGPRLRGNETRADKATQTAKLLRGQPGASIVESLKAHLSLEEGDSSVPRSVLLVVTNPVEATVSWLAEELSWPKRRIVGLGTTVETARFSHYLADRFDVDPSSVWTEIIGEHASNIDVRDRAAVEERIRDLGKHADVDDTLARTRTAASRIRAESEAVGNKAATRLLEKMDREVDTSSVSQEVRNWLARELKFSLAPPATRFAIAAAVLEVVCAIRDDRGRVLPVSGFGAPDVGDELALAAPFILGRDGVHGCALAAKHDVLASAAAEIRVQVEAMSNAPR